MVSTKILRVLKTDNNHKCLLIIRSSY